MHRSFASLWFSSTLLAVIGLGCASTRGTSIPSEGGASWRQLKSPHFTLTTNLDRDDARAGIRALETVRSALIAAMSLRGQISEQTVEVVVLRDSLEFENLFSRYVDGFALTSDVQRFIYMHGRPGSWERRRHLGDESARSILKHELAHQIIAYVFLRQPRWLSEGLAQYYETVAISPDDASATVGLANLESLQMYNSFHVSMEELLEWGFQPHPGDEARVWGLYGASWLLVNYLFNVMPEPFADYQRRLSNGETPASAWKAAFGQLDVSTLSQSLEKYRKHGSYSVANVAVPSPPTEVEERALNNADARAMRARLYLASRQHLPKEERAKRVDAAKAELTKALQEDANNSIALLTLASGPWERPERFAAARRLTEAHPENGQGWLILSSVLTEEGRPNSEREAALLKATQLIPNNGLAWNNLANVFLVKRDLKSAEEAVARAMQLAPWQSAFVDTLAEVQFAKGDCRRAISWQTIAIERLGDGYSPAAVAEYNGRLQKYQDSCAEKSLAPTKPTAATQ
jgi:hypothetical protein